MFAKENQSNKIELKYIQNKHVAYARELRRPNVVRVVAQQLELDLQISNKLKFEENKNKRV